MNTVYHDSPMPDDRRRELLYQGQIFVFSPRPSTEAFCGFAREMVEEAFHPRDPLTAQHELPVDAFVAIVAPLKPRFIHHPRTKELLRELLVDVGCAPEKTYFDVPRLRVTTSDAYLNAGVAYPLHPHRDTWYASPMCQLNWWLPVYPYESESSFAFHPRWWGREVPNTSHEYDHYEWNRVGRAQAAKHVQKDTRKQPKAVGEPDLDPQLRVVVPPGGMILFSGAQLHSSVPNTSGRSRFSIDFRTAHLDELAVRGGAPNLDSRGKGTTLRELMRLSDLAPMPREVLLLHEPEPPEDEEGLVYKPPPEVLQGGPR